MHTTLRSMHLGTISIPVLIMASARMTAREMANVMAGAYKDLGLKHLDQGAFLARYPNKNTA